MSELEDALSFELDIYQVPYKRQYKFCADRKFLADFAFLDSKLIVEVNGGTWMKKSGHNTGTGIQRDYEKSNLAQLLGWTYLQFTKKEIDSLEAVDTIMNYIKRRTQ